MDASADTQQWDSLIHDALVFDGHGGSPRKMDVAVSQGRIAAIGPDLPKDQARSLINGHGQWLMPGLLDIHTHFDLEVEIEPQLPEALRHGTTTVLVANCSLGLAYGNQRRDDADPIVDCFARVENVPKHVLRKVADVATWNDSKDYLTHLSQLPLGPNIVPMIPHSMLRIEVMGLQDSVSREPSDNELAQMGALLEKGMQEGYVGFSTDALPFHYLANQPNTTKQIPTQFAPFSELKFLTNIVRKWDRLWQATPPKDSPKDVVRTFGLTSGRLHGKPLRLAAVAALDVHTNRGLIRLVLTLTRLLNSRLFNGRFRVQALAAPFKTWSDGAITPLSEEIPVLRKLNELDLEDRPGREALMSDPQWTAEFRKMWFKGKTGFNLARVKRWLRMDDNVLSRDLRDMHFDGCPVSEWNGQSFQAVFDRLLAWQTRGEGTPRGLEAETFAAMPLELDEADFVLHLLRRFDTELRWSTVTANRNPALTKRLLFHPLLLPGFNDSGAHLTNMAFYDGNLRTLKMAQEDGLEKVGHAVQRLTREPAEFLGIDAGRLDQGAQADLILVNPEKLEQWNPDQTYEYIWRDCFEHNQLVNRPQGVVSTVMVAGKLAWQDGNFCDGIGRQNFGRVVLDKQHEMQTLQAA